MANIIKSGLWLSASNIVSSGLAYGFQLALAAMLSVSDFAIFTSAIALAAFLCSPMAAISMILTREFAQITVKNKALMYGFYRSVQHKFVLAGVAIFVIANILGSQIYAVTKYDSYQFAAALACYLAITPLIQLQNAYFQGNFLFGQFGLMAILLVLSKIFITLAVVSAGYGVDGAIIGVVLSTTLIFMIGMGVIKRDAQEFVATVMTYTFNWISYRSISVLVAVTFFSALVQLDVVLVNYYFESNDAGMYAIASVLGKAILYIPGGFVIAMFPLAAADDDVANGRKIFNKAMYAALCLCAFSASFYYIFSNSLISFIYGPGYSQAADILKWYGFAIIPISLVFVAEHYLIARGKMFFAWAFAVVAPVQILLISRYHDSITDVMLAMFISGVVLLFSGFVYFRVARIHK